MITPEKFLGIVKDDRTSATFRMGTIDPAYSAGRPRIVFDGESAASTKQYPYVSSYTPAKNDKVLLANVAGTYVVLGKIV